MEASFPGFDVTVITIYFAENQQTAKLMQNTSFLCLYMIISYENKFDPSNEKKIRILVFTVFLSF